MIKVVLASLLTFAALFANTAFDAYFEEAGTYYNIPPQLLKSVATIESDLRANLVGNNTNKTKDYGIMQINSIHLPQLKVYGVNEQNIMEPRINIFVGAALLQNIIKTKGYNWESIGRYHSNTPQHKQRWLGKLVAELKHTKIKPSEVAKIFEPDIRFETVDKPKEQEQQGSMASAQSADAQTQN